MGLGDGDKTQYLAESSSQWFAMSVCTHLLIILISFTMWQYNLKELPAVSSCFFQVIFLLGVFML